MATSPSPTVPAGNPAENYERYFVPAIGVPSAMPVIEAAGLTGGERVLDLACGTGVVSRLAAERVGDAGHVVGVDAHPGMIEVAQRVAPELEWRQAAAEDLPLPDGSFDAAVCSLAYQFFADKIQALREVRRVLTPGGRAVIGTPGPTPPLLEAIGGALAEHLGSQAAGFVDAVFSVHDADEVRAQAAEAGFGDVTAAQQPLPLRVGNPAAFLWQYVYSTPLVETVGPLDDDAKAALQRDVEERCQPFVDGDGMTMAPDLLVTVLR